MSQRTKVSKPGEENDYASATWYGMQGEGRSVWEAALDRTRHVFREFDHVLVQFSGGKDSTATLHVALEIAHETGRLPLRVVHFDEECVSMETEYYVRRVAARDDVDLEWYCLGGDTEVLTRDGTLRIADLAGGEHEIMTEHGRWVSAPVRSFGRRSVQRLVIERNRVRKTITATPDHRWFVAERRRNSAGHRWTVRQERVTADLQPGDELVGTWRERHVQEPSPFGIAHGFTFGDGNRSASGCQVTFHGDKDAALKPYFDGHITSQWNGQPRAIGLPRYFKNLPALSEAPKYLYGWLAGYFAADGCVDARGKPVLSSANRSHLEYVRTLCTDLGIFTFGIQRNDRVTPFGDRPLYSLTLAARDLTPSFFVIPAQRDRFLSVHRRKADTAVRRWRVVEVADAGQAETFCAVVDGTHSFVLADHLLTGNCLPVRQNNACSPAAPNWWSWDPEFEGRWGRPMPPEAVTELDGFPIWPAEDRPSIADCSPLLAPLAKYGRTAALLGIRAEESMVRRRAVSNQRRENWVIPTPARHYSKVYPIYDWRTVDVWTAPAAMHWDYNETYDLMEMAGIPHFGQRCAPPFAAEPMQLLWMWAECFPDLWDRMCDRVPGAAAAARYGKTELYAFKEKPEKPAGVSWQQFVKSLIDEHDETVRPWLARHVQKAIARHFRKTTEPIMPTSRHPDSGISWEWLAMLALRGDFKERKQMMEMAGVGTASGRVKARAAYDAERAAINADPALAAEVYP